MVIHGLSRYYIKRTMEQNYLLEMKDIWVSYNGAPILENIDLSVESGDFLGRDRALGAVRPGDLLAVLCAGAYGFTMSSNYNSRPRVAEVLVTDSRWRVIRQRETVDDLMRGEEVDEPSYG